MPARDVRWPLHDFSHVVGRPEAKRFERLFERQGAGPTKPAAYRVGSGAVHSQPWVLDDDAAFDPMTRHLEWRFDPAALAGSVDLAITASVLTLEAFAAMLGQDPSRERVEAKRREGAVSKLVLPLLQR